MTDLDLSLDMTKYRTYDYTTGRFMQVDPLADSLVSLSPYNYSYNNPINYNDPFGDTPCCMPQARKTRLFGNRYTMATAPEPLKEPISAIGWLAGMALEGAWSLMQDQELNAIPFEPSPIAAAKGVGYLDDAIKAIKGLDNLDDVGKIDEIVSSVAKNHELFQCVQCSDDIVKTNGTYKAVLLNGKVYDNINPSGISYNDWVKDLHSPTGYVITETTF
ncbi:hypothetical protein LVD17_14655 [Fulvivirga ulvae]|nr:hypothetical protein LVD17_14655 [Fulvivirga ulvae]